MPAGRPALVSPGALYTFAHQFYWDFRRLEEGSERRWFDRKAYERLAQAIEQADLGASPEQSRRIRENLDQSLRDGRVQTTDKEEWLRQSHEGQKFANRSYLLMHAGEVATTVKKIPGEPDVLDALLSADTPEQVREICRDAHVITTIEIEPGVSREAEVPNWPLPYGSVLPMYLSQYAEAFIAAKRDRRYPQSERTSSRLKQLWFLSRALAGALFNVRTRTAINLVGSTRPEEVFERSRAARLRRRSKKRKP
jgi:hypothetical protein